VTGWLAGFPQGWLAVFHRGSALARAQAEIARLTAEVQRLRSGWMYERDGDEGEASPPDGVRGFVPRGFVPPACSTGPAWPPLPGPPWPSYRTDQPEGAR
jgi:hypothetical protein